MNTEFDDFMQDMYDEEELQYMDSGFVNALRVAFNHGWIAYRQSLVVKLSDLPEASYETSGTCYVSHVEDALDAAGVRYE